MTRQSPRVSGPYSRKDAGVLMGGATFDVPQGGTNQRDGVSIPIPRSSVQASPASRLHGTPANPSCQFGAACLVGLRPFLGPGEIGARQSGARVRLSAQPPGAPTQNSDLKIRVCAPRLPRPPSLARRRRRCYDDCTCLAKVWKNWLRLCRAADWINRWPTLAMSPPTCASPE